ncbi:YdaU family protein [Chromobacterium violaceum]|uniref:YdaU family protein n=1 Tax=Chromobacterium violaceum TaxID=536 RepID=UPI00385BC595
MNYYEHHIGDYAEATAHLSFVEDAAYSRLIRKYYALEGPLPADLRAVQRLICARTDEEREAVEIVLGEFFTLADDGYHNARCDEEICRFREKQEKARRSANARWNKGKQHNDGDADDKDAALPSQSGRNANASKPEQPSNANASPSEYERMETECKSNAHQSPDTNTEDKSSYGGVTRTHAHVREEVLGTSVPADFAPDHSHRGIAHNMGLDLQAERDKFVDHFTATGEVLADWPAKFRNWLRNANKLGDSKFQPPPGRRSSPPNLTDHNRAAADRAKVLLFGDGTKNLEGVT